MEIEGTVSKKMVGKSSKTQYEAVYINSAKGNFALREAGKSPFKNSQLNKLVGKKIRVVGELVKDVFFVTDWEELK